MAEAPGEELGVDEGEGAIELWQLSCDLEIQEINFWNLNLTIFRVVERYKDFFTVVPFLAEGQRD